MTTICIDEHHMEIESINEESLRMSREDGSGSGCEEEYLIQMPDSPSAKNDGSGPPGGGSGNIGPSGNMEHEKRLRREIANSNERRRMQSINAGFNSLRNLLPHHEGEKLSKAAILQQTATYIVELEREKTHLLNQNAQLKRLLESEGTEVPSLKKRKLETVYTVQTVSDSSDEGLGSMSPEPITLITNGSSVSAVKNIKKGIVTPISKELVELRAQLDRERRDRKSLEEQVRRLQDRYTVQYTELPIQYQHQEVIEHTDNLRDDNVAVSIIQPSQMSRLENVQVLSLDSNHLNVGDTQVVVCGSMDDIEEDDSDSRTLSPVELCHDDLDIKEEVIIGDELVEVTTPTRMQPILEAAIKAEPKVEVERINSSGSVTVIRSEDETVTLAPGKTRTVVNAANGGRTRGARGQMILTTSTSRQNLETIVEAIRHLEGDLFEEVTDARTTKSQTSQEVPLALINNKRKTPQQNLHAQMNPYLQFRPAGSSETATRANVVVASAATVKGNNTVVTATPCGTAAARKIIATSKATPVSSISVQHQQQCRPGVIVVKQSS